MPGGYRASKVRRGWYFWRADVFGNKEGKTEIHFPNKRGNVPDSGNLALIARNAKEEGGKGREENPFSGHTGGGVSIGQEDGEHCSAALAFDPAANADGTAVIFYDAARNP